MPTVPAEVTLKILVEVATLNKVEAVELPMAILPVERMRILSVPAVVRIISPVELAVKVLAEDIKVVLAELMVKVEVVPVVCQVEAATPVRLRPVSEVMLAEPMVIVLPMVVVPTKIFFHLAAAEPRLYVRLAFGRRFPVIVVVAAANVPLKIVLPVP